MSIGRCVGNARIARRLAAGLVERGGEHQCDEQHRAFVAHIARSARRDLPALVEQRAEMAELRLLAVAAGNDMRAIADGERDFGHQPRSSRAITSSSAWTASAIRARNAACRLASVSFWRVRAVTARSIRAIARSMRSVAAV